MATSAGSDGKAPLHSTITHCIWENGSISTAGVEHVTTLHISQVWTWDELHAQKQRMRTVFVGLFLFFFTKRAKFKGRVSNRAKKMRSGIY